MRYFTDLLDEEWVRSNCDEIGAWDGSEEPQNDPSQSAGADITADPRFQNALNAALLQERQRMQQMAEKELQGLKKNRDDLLEEKKRWASLGDPEQIQRSLQEAEALRQAVEAREKGIDPDILRKEAERIAQEKFKQHEASVSEVHKAREEELQKLRAQVEEERKARHKEFVLAHLMEAAMPESMRIFHPGALNHLVDTLAPHVVAHEVPGLGVQPRLQINGALVPGDTPDGAMSLRQALPLLRNPGDKPLLGQDISYFFTSNATGSGTQSPRGSSPSAMPKKPWSEMTSRERVEMTNNHPADVVRRHIQDSAGKRN